jgi:uncharacterized membrane protein
VRFQAARRSESRRLIGVDAARGLALIGMMAVHITPSTTPDGEASVVYLLASGRAAALFAVLAGVGIALATGGSRRPRGRAHAAAAAGIAARAVVLLAVGLALGALDSGVAVILVYYAVLFIVALPFLGLGPRILLPLAATWAIAMPFLSYALRQEIPRGFPSSPSFEDLGDPGGLAIELTLTGYYPVLTWTAYLILGLGLGRLNLRALRTQVAFVVVGGLVALIATATSRLLLETGGLDHLHAVGAGSHPIGARSLDVALTTGFFGTTPTTSWWWLATAAPHSSTPFNLLQTMGIAVAVLGVMLLLGSYARVVLWPLAAMGGMTFTLYSVHVVLLATVVPRELDNALLLHVLITAGIAILWRGVIGRGPLETVASGSAQLAQRAVRSGRGSSEPLVGQRVDHSG